MTAPTLTRPSRGRCAALLLVAAAAAACDGRPTPAGPIAPGAVANTPGGVAAANRTDGPTAGPTPTPTAAPTRVVAPPEPLGVPPNFGVGVYAEGLGAVRFLAVAPNGDLLATVPELDRVLVLPDRDGDGVADRVAVFAEGEPLNRPHGIAIHGPWLYVANTDGVLRFPYAPGDLEPSGEHAFLVELPGGGEHWTRSIVFGPDDRLYVSVGSSCNACVETDARRAAVMRFEADGGGGALFSTGLRNAVGLAVNPATGAIWASENGRDLLGDDRPPDELDVLLSGGNYGWPHCYGDRVRDGEVPSPPGYCAATLAAALELGAHVAPLGMAFYTGRQFPEEMHGDLFVALHGSWNRTLPVGYEVVRVPFEGGAPTGEVLPFVSGWLRPDTRRWGRPVQPVVAADGALFVSDDGGGRVWRVYYAPPVVRPTPWR